MSAKCPLNTYLVSIDYTLCLLYTCWMLADYTCACCMPTKYLLNTCVPAEHLQSTCYACHMPTQRPRSAACLVVAVHVPPKFQQQAHSEHLCTVPPFGHATQVNPSKCHHSPMREVETTVTTNSRRRSKAQRGHLGLNSPRRKQEACHMALPGTRCCRILHAYLSSLRNTP